jgi:hypothetical protein
LRHKGVHQGCLADPRLSDDESNPTHTLQRGVKPLVQSGQLDLPADQWGLTNNEGLSSSGNESGGWIRGGTGPALRRRSVEDRDLCHEPIPPPPYRFDELRSLGIVFQRLAQLANAYGHCGLAHVRIRPHRVQQSVFGHELCGVLRKVAQHGKSLVRQVNHVLSAPQPLVGDVDPKRSEYQDFAVSHGLHPGIVRVGRRDLIEIL